MISNRALTLESRVATAPDQLSCELHDETVILGMRTGEYFGLNPVATLIWRMLADERRVNELLEAVLARYPEIDREECSRDLLEVLTDFLDFGLIELRHQTAADQVQR